MLALTLIQPWAWAIAHAGKDVENRTWAPPRHLIGADLAIHAGAKPCDEWALDGLFEVTGPLVDPRMVTEEEASESGCRVIEMPGAEALPRSAIVCVARVVRVERLGEGRARFSPWYCGPVGWVLDNVRALATPVPCKGARGLWELPADVETEVRRQIGTSPRRWLGPRDDDLAPDGVSLRRKVPPERWPYGAPAAHQGCCGLHLGGLYCDCATSDASDTEWGQGA